MSGVGKDEVNPPKDAKRWPNGEPVIVLRPLKRGVTLALAKVAVEHQSHEALKQAFTHGPCEFMGYLVQRDGKLLAVYENGENPVPIDPVDILVEPATCDGPTEPAVFPMRLMKRVVIESPYYSADKAEQERNISYALECLRDSLQRGEAPFASHLLYTRVLDDANVEERRLGMQAAMEWIDHSETTAIYIDLGVSPGMRLGIQQAYVPFRIAVRTLRGNMERACRLLAAYERHPSSLPADQCDHQLDTPVIGVDRLDRCVIDGWRCGCSAKRTEPEPWP